MIIVLLYLRILLIKTSPLSYDNRFEIPKYKLRLLLINAIVPISNAYQLIRATRQKVERYRHFGGLFGSHRTVFYQRLRDKDVEELSQNFAVRSVEYTVDLERYTAVPSSLIDSIRISVII